MIPESGRRRVVIEGVAPQIDCGRFPIKRTVGDALPVEADVFADGHDVVACALLHRPPDGTAWRRTPMDPLGNDRWRAELTVSALGRWHYTVEGWIDRFATWRRDLEKRVAADHDVTTDLQIGARLLEETAARADEAAATDDAARLRGWAQTLRAGEDLATPVRLALDEDVARTVGRHPDRTHATRYERELTAVVDPERARFSTWYELFPRSAAPEPDRHGTLADVIDRLPEIAAMGFDVLYLPPIHPIGVTHRKGKNNARTAEPDDVGSPWAIGGAAGGHTAVHPKLGTLADVRRLAQTARQQHGIELALDIAFQASPDHPYVAAHPEWFRHRPDGTIQYAENPPKKYEDIYPFDFEGDAWQTLWAELKDVFEHWIDHGVRVFRVDNPHTKPLPFWEWVIDALKREHPELIFLSEAFTRPKIMYRLAKLGFSQSYTYFTWRTTKHELMTYLTELTQTEVREFFRPNLWPNTPDILTEQLQHGGRPVFAQRLVLAATLGASYGIYGPAYELLEDRPRAPGSEEYLDSEKYQLRHWDRGRPESLRDFIARVNEIRRAHPALQHNRGLRFHRIDNEALLAYSKRDPAETDHVLVVVNLDPHHTQSGWLELSPAQLGLPADTPFSVHDLLTDAYYHWDGARHYVELDPHSSPAHIFRLQRRVRSEQDFDYFV